MLRNLLSTPTVRIGCSCRFYARGRNRFSRPSAAADPKEFLNNISAINKVPSFGKTRHSNDFEDPDDMSRYEGDFINMESTHKVHKQELIQERERIKHRTVQAKYFRTDKLNFLTWAEKEQIRYLHARDEEEWCVEKLSESFPADCETIAKILKARWTPKNAAKIQKHDEGVRRAWLSLKENSVGDIDPELREHLQKFSGRTVQGSLLEVPTVPSKDVKEEFSKIITSCKKYQRPTQSIEDDSTSQLANPLKLPPPTTDDTFVMGKVSRSKPLMFRELDIPDNFEEAKPHKHAHNPFVNPADLANVTENQDSTNTSSPPMDTLNLMSKYEMSDVQSTEDDMRKLSMPAIRDHITIPKHLWQRGATYKLDDCFYDDDGEFLYRVPGMTGRK